MNRDAKISLVVLLIIVGLLVIIWGRGEQTDTDALVNEPGSGERGPGVMPNSINTLSGRAGANLPDGLRTASPEGARVVSNAQLRIPPTPPTPEPKAVENPGPAPTPAPTPKYWTYTVSPEDIALSQIARDQLGKEIRWREIAKLNKIPPPYVIRRGDKLKMPAKEGETGTIAPAPTPTPDPVTPAPTPTAARTYTVRKGDIGLMQIARDQLGDARRWKEIATLNGLTKTSVIKIGQVLRLPR